MLKFLATTESTRKSDQKSRLIIAVNLLKNARVKLLFVYFQTTFLKSRLKIKALHELVVTETVQQILQLLKNCENQNVDFC